MTDITSSGSHGAHLLCRDTITPSSQRSDRAAFFGVAALLFAASVAAAIACGAAMAAMGELPMSGGWTLSSMWTRMCGESWLHATASFLTMWAVMMMAMMLPAVMPMLWRCRLAFGRTTASAANRLTALTGAGYFLVWIVLGAAIFPLGAALAAIEMREPVLARATPLAAGVVVLIAGLVQLTTWKADHLACCRELPGHSLTADAATALRLGLRLGLHCSACSAGLTAMLLVLGIMDLRVMTIVTAAIMLERLLPAGQEIARAIGAVICAAGLLMIVRAAGLA